MSKTRKWLVNLFILLWIIILVGIAGVRWEFLPLQAALLMASVGAALVLLYGILLLPVVLYKLVFRKSPAASSVFMCLLGLLPALVLLVSVGPQGLQAPAIHDITTDTENPPEFVLAAQQRAASDNSAAYEGEVIARLQEEAYPDIEPLFLANSPEKVLAVIDATARQQGWTVLGTRQSEEPGVAGVVEAVSASAIFGFEDDVAIRVSAAAEGGSRVDIRSASRVGLGDLGANANRIRVFKQALEEKF